MATHFHHMKNVTFKSVETLLEFLKETKPSEQTLIVDIREQSYSLPSRKSSLDIHRVFIQTTDSGVFINVGWVMNEDVSRCLLCCHSFNYTTRWRHHCRCCGNLICSECCRNSCLIATKEDLGLLKVCNNCYRPNETIPILNTRSIGRSVVPIEYQTSHPVESIATVTTSTTTGTTTTTTTAVATAIAYDTERGGISNELHLVPYPGFVIKTRRASYFDPKSGVTVDCSDEKVFINVFHHKDVIDNEMKLLKINGDISQSQVETTNGSMEHKTNESGTTLPIGETMLPMIYLGTPRATVDKSGNESTLYTVLISSNYFDPKYDRKKVYTSPAIVQKIIEVVNKTYQDTLIEEEYVRPRIKCGYKGEPLLEPETFVLSPVRVTTILRIMDEETRSVITKTTTSTIRPIMTHRPRIGILHSLDSIHAVAVNESKTITNDSNNNDNHRPHSISSDKHDNKQLLEQSNRRYSTGNVKSTMFSSLFRSVGNNNTTGGGTGNTIGGGTGVMTSSNNNNSNSNTTNNGTGIVLTGYSSATQTAMATYKMNNTTTLSPSHSNNSNGNNTIVSHSIPIPIPSNGLSQRTTNTSSSSINGNNQRIPDNVSELSDSTYLSQSISDVSLSQMSSSSNTMNFVSSFFDSVTEKYGSNGSQYLSEDMVIFVKENNVSISEAQMIVGLSVSRPTALLGWQVMVFLDPGQSIVEGIYVITGIRKNTMRKTEFRLSSFGTGKIDQWAKLKRGDGKGGVDFRPLRKVLNFVQ